MAVNYIGNPDFRGYLAYLAKQGDGRADLAINGYGTGYVDNNGKINMGLLNELNQAAPGAGTSDKALQAAQVKYLQDQYDTFQGLQSGGGAGGGSAGTAQDRADEQAYWQDQIENANRQLARLPKQLQAGEDNIQGSYQTAYDRLVGDKATTQRDYNTKRGQTVEDNITAKGAIDTSVRNQNTALQRLLGSRGAGSSSAATILAPYAAAVQGNNQRQQVQTAYGRNIQGLDTSWGDYQNDWQDSAQDLDVQRQNQLKTLRSGIDDTKAQLLDEQGNAAVQKAQAGGASYTAARNARTPYMARINKLIDAIDKLGTNVNLTPKTVAYKAPELSTYTFNRYGAPTMASGGASPGALQNAGAYWTLLGNPDDKKNQQL